MRDASMFYYALSVRPGRPRSGGWPAARALLGGEPMRPARHITAAGLAAWLVLAAWPAGAPAQHRVAAGARPGMPMSQPGFAGPRAPMPFRPAGMTMSRPMFMPSMTMSRPTFMSGMAPGGLNPNLFAAQPATPSTRPTFNPATFLANHPNAASLAGQFNRPTGGFSTTALASSQFGGFTQANAAALQAAGLKPGQFVANPGQFLANPGQSLAGLSNPDRSIAAADARVLATLRARSLGGGGAATGAAPGAAAAAPSG